MCNTISGVNLESLKFRGFFVNDSNHIFRAFKFDFHFIHMPVYTLCSNISRETQMMSVYSFLSS